MSDPTDPIPQADPVPIDAEFEPARPKRDDRSQSRGGPGWLAFGGLGLVALFTLVAALAGHGLVPGINPAASIEQQMTAKLATQSDALNAVKAEQSALDSELSEVKSRLDTQQADRTRLRSEFRDLRDAVAERPSNGADQVASGEALQNLQNRLDQIELALAALPATETTGENNSLVPDLTRRLDGLAADISALKTQLSALETQIATERNSAIQSTNKRTDAALALSAIEAAARRGQPFLAAQQRLDAALPGNRAASDLAPLAIKQIPTLSELRESFPPLAEAALDLEAETSPGASGFIRNLFGDGVSVRRKEGAMALDHIETARTALSAGKLNDAAKALKSLDPEIQSVFTDWVNNAEDRVLLETMLEALRLTMIAEERQ